MVVGSKKRLALTYKTKELSESMDVVCIEWPEIGIDREIGHFEYLMNE